MNTPSARPSLLTTPALEHVRALERALITARRSAAWWEAIGQRLGDLCDRFDAEKRAQAHLLARAEMELGEARVERTEALRSVAILEGYVQVLQRGVDTLTAILDGRRGPPTDEEIDLHWRRGGAWLVEHAVLRSREEVRRRAAQYREGSPGLGVVWRAIDKDCRPCAWPEVLS